MAQDPALKLALTLHHSPGVYALLLGSGISRVAGIPTGWEITLDLIRKVACLNGETKLGDDEAETWYRTMFDEPPGYSSLLDHLTTTPAERMRLLRQYFEPNEAELEQGAKKPTAAHLAIAELVKSGHIRMIITTNFDRLLEDALRQHGIEPDVISTDEQIPAAFPYAHSPCVIVKVHGDYRDTTLKNTDEELTRYSPELDRLLDRIFDDFGLIVCGWSAAWDHALRAAICRVPSRRFATFWLSRGRLDPLAQDVITKRRAEVIDIAGADAAFRDLASNVRALDELRMSDPLPTAVALASVERILLDPTQQVRLFNLLHDATERAYEVTCAASVKISPQVATKDGLAEFLARMEQALEPPAAMLACVSYHGKSEHLPLIIRTLERFLNPRAPIMGGIERLPYYPALFLSYAAGIAAVAGRNYAVLPALWLRPRYRLLPYDPMTAVEPVYVLNINQVFNHIRELVAPGGVLAPSFHLFDVLRRVLSKYLPDDEDYATAFDRFEFLLCLVHFSEHPGAVHGRFLGRWGMNWDRSPMAQLGRAIEAGQAAELTGSGLFEGDQAKLAEAYRTFKEWFATHHNQFW